MSLRPYQEAALEQLRAAVRSGKRRVLLTSPTGSGKSLIIAAMIDSAIAKGKRALFVVHRRELVMQLSERLTMPHRVMMGRDSRGDASEPVVVASIQTIGRRDPPPADLILIDEAHRARADSYLRLLDRYPGVPVIGYTASPWRTDGRGLGDLFEANVVAATPAQLIRDGWLCGYRGFAFVAPDLTGVRTIAGDWDEKGLSLAYQRSTIYADIIEKWQKHAQGRQTIVFAASIENSKEIVERFRQVGVNAEHLDYTTPGDRRAAVLGLVRSGAVTVLSNVSILGEGIDLPELAVAILARPTKSLTVYLQQVGRVMRPKADGSKALILDHSSNVLRHGLPDAERCYDLTTTKPKEVVAALHTCKSCFCIYEGGPTCPECAMVQPTVSRSGPDVSLAHQEVDIRSVTRRDVDAFKEELIRIVVARKLQPGYLVHRFLEKFPGAPKPWGAFREAKRRLEEAQSQST
jgi:DNA repair protein RadD